MLGQHQKFPCFEMVFMTWNELFFFLGNVLRVTLVVGLSRSSSGFSEWKVSWYLSLPAALSFPLCLFWPKEDKGRRSGRLMILNVVWNRVCNRVFNEQDFPQDVPGQFRTGRPVVLLSRDKNLSLSRYLFFPGQGQVQKSRDNSSVSRYPGTKLLSPKTKNSKRMF